jgi:hypothetical protein
MSLGIFGLLVLGTVVSLCWKAGMRIITTAVVAMLLGIVIAGNDGPMADLASGLVDALRSTLDSLWDALESTGKSLFGGDR